MLKPNALLSAGLFVISVSGAWGADDFDEFIGAYERRDQARMADQVIQAQRQADFNAFRATTENSPSETARRRPDQAAAQQAAVMEARRQALKEDKRRRKREREEAARQERLLKLEEQRLALQTERQQAELQAAAEAQARAASQAVPTAVPQTQSSGQVASSVSAPAGTPVQATQPTPGHAPTAPAPVETASGSTSVSQQGIAPQAEALVRGTNAVPEQVVSKAIVGQPVETTAKMSAELPVQAVQVAPMQAAPSNLSPTPGPVPVHVQVAAPNETQGTAVAPVVSFASEPPLHTAAELAKPELESHATRVDAPALSVPAVHRVEVVSTSTQADSATRGEDSGFSVKKVYGAGEDVRGLYTAKQTVDMMQWAGSVPEAALKIRPDLVKQGNALLQPEITANAIDFAASLTEKGLSKLTENQIKDENTRDVAAKTVTTMGKVVAENVLLGTTTFGFGTLAKFSADTAVELWDAGRKTADVAATMPSEAEMQRIDPVGYANGKYAFLYAVKNGDVKGQVTELGKDVLYKLGTPGRVVLDGTTSLITKAGEKLSNTKVGQALNNTIEQGISFITGTPPPAPYVPAVPTPAPVPVAYGPYLPSVPQALNFSTNSQVRVNAAGAGMNLRPTAKAGGTSLGTLKAGEQLQITGPAQYSASDGHYFYPVRVTASGKTGFVAAGENGSPWMAY